MSRVFSSDAIDHTLPWLAMNSVRSGESSISTGSGGATNRQEWSAGFRRGRTTNHSTSRATIDAPMMSTNSTVPKTTSNGIEFSSWTVRCGAGWTLPSDPAVTARLASGRISESDNSREEIP